jgi:hypothetical protein
MPDVSPDLAKKVTAADLRNTIKKVGDGGNLSPADRQMFIAFASAEDQAAMREARTSALLRKWLSGGRLSKAEQAEIAHLLPAAANRVVSDQYRLGPEGYGHIGIERRTFFRWKSHGEMCPDGADLPPFDAPEMLEGWYERMRLRGVFKHRFPAKVRDAIASYLAANGRQPSKSDPAGPTRPSEPTGSVPASFTGVDHGKKRGLAFEVEQEERRVADLRHARDQAYHDDDRAGGDILDKRYREALESLSLLKQRCNKVLKEEGELVTLEQIEREWGPRLETIVQGGLMFYDRIASKLEALPDHASRRRFWREQWINHCRVLSQGDFAPVLELEES